MSSGQFSILKRVVILVSVVFVFLILHIWVRMQFVTESFRLSSLRRELRELESTQLVKQVLRDELYKPQRLEALNISEAHNLTLPNHQRILDLKNRTLQ